MMFLMFFVEHQDETVNGVATVVTWVTELPVVGPPVLEWMENSASEDGTVKMWEMSAGKQLKSFIKAWGGTGNALYQPQ